MAVGLGSMDVPVPAVAAWEWLNWKFPRAVRAGDTIYARWILTQKRAPIGGAPTAIVVWRVDVHTADGALCAEGEVGASILRNVAAAKTSVAEPAEGVAAVPRRRGRRRPPGGDGAKSAAETKKAVVAQSALPTPQVAGSAAAPAAQDRPAGRPRRRRRRRSPGSSTARNGDAPESPAAATQSATSAPPPAEAVGPAPRAEATANPLTRAIRRLRRP